MIPNSANRVAMRTDPIVNEQIRRRTEKNIAYFQNHLELIDGRLRELDREWDVERLLETASSAMSLTGLMLGITRNRKFLLLPLAVQGFMLMHAIDGWCPPLPVLRRLGFRTEQEINHERFALKTLRGDFEGTTAADLAVASPADHVMRAVTR